MSNTVANEDAYAAMYLMYVFCNVDGRAALVEYRQTFETPHRILSQTGCFPKRNEVVKNGVGEAMFWQE
jgi:hypothetical protein